VLIGWALGDVGAGLVATLGAFTADYATDRPYFNRGVQSAIVAVGLAAAVTVGAWAATTAWVAVATISAVAVLAVWLCAALSLGPPGAYMFVVVCAAGVGVSASHLPAWQIGLLVLAGGAIAWVAQMSAALTGSRAPEKSVVAAAGEAVAVYIEQAGTDQSTAARRCAAAALARAWQTIVDQQPRSLERGGLQGLREANYSLTVLFTDSMSALSRGAPMPADAATARAVGTLDRKPVVGAPAKNRPLLRRPDIATQLARAVKPGAHARRVMLRVAIAAPLAGALAANLGVSHAYWAIATAVLVLHQGAHRFATLQRAAERVVGTVVGLGLTAGILALRPQGLWMVVVVALLQFVIELFIVRNYALAAAFITAIALTIASAAHRVDVITLVFDRGLATVIGCSVGIGVYLIAVRGQESQRINSSLADMLRQTATATEFLARGDGSSLAARAARRELQQSLFDLIDSEDAARSGSRRDRAAAARLSAIVLAAEHLGYATFNASWSAEHSGTARFGSADPDTYLDLIRELSESVRRSSHTPSFGGELPPFAAPEIRILIDALTAESHSQ
jgi:uncharacterized membrane protein YccC